jgi:hypothetical protein
MSTAARIERFASTARAALATAGGPDGVPVGGYQDASGAEHTVALVHTEEGGWEVHDRGPGEPSLVENLGSALEEAVAVALEYLRDMRGRAAHARARQLASAVLRRQAALTGDRLVGPVVSRRAA